MSSDGTRVAIGARGNDGNGANAGHVRVYAESGGTWTQVGADIDGEATKAGTVGDYSGSSVSMSSDGKRVAIGAHGNDGTTVVTGYYDDDSRGHVRVYAESGGTWTQLGADIGGEAAGDESGYSVSMSPDGTRVAIGAPGNDGNERQSRPSARTRMVILLRATHPRPRPTAPWAPAPALASGSTCQPTCSAGYHLRLSCSAGTLTGNDVCFFVDASRPDQRRRGHLQLAAARRASPGHAGYAAPASPRAAP